MIKLKEKAPSNVSQFHLEEPWTLLKNEKEQNVKSQMIIFLALQGSILEP